MFKTAFRNVKLVFKVNILSFQKLTLELAMPFSRFPKK